MNWGIKLRETRRFRGIKQGDLAKRAHITQQTVSRIEKGKSIPNIEAYDDLLRCMGFCLTISTLDEAECDWRLP